MAAMVEKKSPPPHEVLVDTIRAVIRIICMVAFLGYLIMWIMSPTNTYWSNWWPSIQKKLDSTYLLIQGINLFTYTFPILFIAVLGCVYVHLGKKFHDNRFESNGKKQRLAFWRRPLLVNGPLGIVSIIELTFLIMFLAFVVWSFSIMVHDTFKSITPQVVGGRKEQLWETKLYNVATILGLTGNIGLSFLFFPVARGSSVLPLFCLTSEASIKYHIWLGHIVMVIFTAHGLGYVIYWCVTNRVSEMVKWQKDAISNVPGEISLLAGLVLWATTLPRIRRRMFELFFYTHYLYIVFLVFFVFHLGISYACIMLPGFYLFLIDRCLRFLQSRQKVRLVSARILPCETLELNFSKSPGLSYNPTSTMFINVPSVSKLQWHPFTINSNSNLEPENLSVVIKSKGSWTKKLYQMLSSPSSIDRLEISIEGPYGPASTHFLRHDTLVMVSGGSGITPFISIIRELIFTSTTLKSKTPKVILICAFKKSLDLKMLDLLLPISDGTPAEMSNLQLQIDAYVTREKETITENSKLIQTIWFKPYATDAPISAILGPNSWLWLGAIISSSFVIFLIIIGIITRYYIYPIDHNISELFTHMVIRAVLNMLIICVCIAATASAAVFWNKKHNAKEIKQIQNMEGITPARSPDTYYNADRELESLPHQSIVQATNVHYGERPDLKRVLFECKGSSVGVLVCGPKKMRHEVANICSSRLADNLHFQSISFSW